MVVVHKLVGNHCRGMCHVVCVMGSLCYEILTRQHVLTCW